MKMSGGVELAATADRVTLLCGPSGRHAAALLPAVAEGFDALAIWAMVEAHNAGVRRLAVIRSDDALAGVVSMDDLAREAQHERRAERDREFVDSFAAVAGPRSRETGTSPLVPNHVA